MLTPVKFMLMRARVRQETKVPKCKNSHFKCYSTVKGPEPATLSPGLMSTFYQLKERQTLKKAKG